MTRQHKTPRQRAEEALAVEQRRVERLFAKREQLTAELTGLEDELHEARVRRDYLAQHPDLNSTTPTTRTTIEENHTA